MAQPQSNRRNWRNTWLAPRLQLRYGMIGFVFAAVAVLVAQALTFLSVRSEALRVLDQAGGDAAGLREIVDVAMRTALLEGLWLFPVLAAITLFGAAHLLHRFIGPQVPIRRTIERLRDGEYGVTCRIRSRDELHALVADLNDLSVTLHERHAGTEAAEASRRRQSGFSLIEVLVILATVSIITAIGVGQFLRAYDRSRQRSTMADMRMIASANGAFYVDHGGYSSDLDTLEPYYFQPVPDVDRWGYAWQYASEGEKTYSLTSRGADGLPGPDAPMPWPGDPFECDLVLESGTFSQSPDI